MKIKTQQVADGRPVLLITVKTGIPYPPITVIPKVLPSLEQSIRKYRKFLAKQVVKQFYVPLEGLPEATHGVNIFGNEFTATFSPPNAVNSASGFREINDQPGSHQILQNKGKTLVIEVEFFVFHRKKGGGSKRRGQPQHIGKCQPTG